MCEKNLNVFHLKVSASVLTYFIKENHSGKKKEMHFFHSQELQSVLVLAINRVALVQSKILSGNISTTTSHITVIGLHEIIYDRGWR